MGLSDAYAKAKWITEEEEAAGDGEQRWQSTVVMDSLSPWWNARFEMAVYEEERDQLSLAVLDYDVLGQHDLLGAVTVSLAEVLGKGARGAWGQRQSVWLTKGGKSAPRGRLFFQCRYDRYTTMEDLIRDSLR